MRLKALSFLIEFLYFIVGLFIGFNKNTFVLKIKLKNLLLYAMVIFAL